VSRARAGWLLLAAWGVACGPAIPEVPAPTVLEPVGAPTLAATAGPPGVTLTLRARDAAGAPKAGVTVLWSVTAGGGAVAPDSVVTAGDGLATVVYTGGLAGTASVRADASDADPIVFSITVTPGPPTQVEATSGDNQIATAGAPLTAPLVVTARDQAGNPVPGVAVTWSATAGGRIRRSTAAVTGVDGRASATWLTGTTAGLQTATAAAAGVATPATFRAATAAGPALVASIPVPPNYGIHDTFVRDGLAFVCAWNTGLIIYDVGNGFRSGRPDSAVEVSRIVTSSNGIGGGAQVHNAWWYHAPGGAKRYVFVGQEGPGGIGFSSSGDIHVVDILNINQPVEVAFYHLAGAGTHNFWVDETNEVLYAAYYNGGVVALDVSGTLSGDLGLAGREIARIQPGGAGNTYIWGVHLHTNGSLYATDMLSGFWQLQLVGGAFQVPVGGGNVSERFGSDQWVHGNYAYSGTWGQRAGVPGNALKIWQLAASGAPTLVDSIITAGIGTVSDVEVSSDGRLLMFSAENGPSAGLRFFSLVADPAQPQPIASVTVASGVHTATMATIAGHRYVFAARNPGSPALLIYDVTSIGP